MHPDQPTLANDNPIEFPVMLHAGSKPCMGIIERISTSECRIRSLVEFAPQTRVEFDIATRGLRAKVRGTIVDAQTRPPRWYYAVQIESLPSGERETLARAIDELNARLHATHLASESGGLARASVRVPVNFPVEYVNEGGERGTGNAGDLSVGGMLMVCDPLLEIGKPLTLSFRLPATSGAEGSAMRISARIVAHQLTSDGRWSNNLAFTGVDPSIHADLTHFVGARATAAP